MLIVHPNSSCDVCLEHYGNGSKSPHSISCGHVFCQSCLESIATGICPLCRDRFHPLDTRRLHIDIDVQGVADSSDETSIEARRLQNSIARIVKDGSSESHLRALIEECGTFLKTQTRGQHEDLRVSFRMISYLCDVKSSLKKQSENFAKLEIDHDTLRVQLTAELEASERKFQDLLQTSTDEKETALAVEKSLREHYKQVLMRCEAAEAECDRLSQALQRFRPDSLADQLCPVEAGPCQKVDDVPFPTQDDLLEAMIKGIAIPNPDKEGLYLSPLPESIDHLPSSLKSFVALPEVDYDFEKARDNNQNMTEMKPAPLNVPGLVTSVTDPLHITSEYPSRDNRTVARAAATPMSTNPHAPKIPSGLSLTAPQGPDMCEPDAQMPSRPPSRRSSRHSSPSPFKPTSVAHQPIPIRDSFARDRGRSLVLGQNEPERLRSQLHDLLSNSGSSSLPNISHFPSSNTPQGSSSPLQSRSGSSISQRPLPAYPSGNTYPPATTPSPPASQLSNSLNSTAQRPVISHASSAAMALEKERQKAEKERQKAAENDRQKAERDQRRQLSAGASTNSLREHAIAYISVQNSTSRREPTNIYGTSTMTGGLGSSTRDSTNAHSLPRGNSGSLRDATNAYATQHIRQPGLGNGKGRLTVQTLFT